MRGRREGRRARHRGGFEALGGGRRRRGGSDDAAGDGRGRRGTRVVPVGAVVRGGRVVLLEESGIHRDVVDDWLVGFTSEED